MRSTPCSFRYWPGGRVLLERARRRDVVGRDRVAEQAEDARVLDRLEPLGRLRRHPLEVRRTPHVGRVVLPLVAVALGDVDPLPVVVALEQRVAVAVAEHLGLDGGLDRGVHLLLRRPDVAQVDVLAVRVLAERVVHDVEVHPAGQRVGDAKRRRGQVVHLHLGVDPALEVAVARQHRAHDQARLLDRLRDRLGQRPRVPDARRAAVADQVEAELDERLVEAGALRGIR